MSCAPFQVLRSQQRKPLFPSVRTCRALRDHETHPECCCRAYPNRGFYVVGACGHAHAWDLHRADADAQAERLLRLASSSSSTSVEVAKPEEPASAGAFVALGAGGQGTFVGMDLAPGPDLCFVDGVQVHRPEDPS